MASDGAVKQHNVEKSDESETTSTDRSLLDFMKKDDQDESKVITTEFDDKIHVSEPEPKFDECKVEDEEKVGSSDEEVEEGGEIKKEKKGLKEKIAEKIHKEEDTSVPVQGVAEHEENKGSLENTKDKLPGGGNKVEEETVAPVECDAVEGSEPDKKGPTEKMEDKLPGGGDKVEEEKVSATAEGGKPVMKGIMDKIKEKMPGNHPKTNSTVEEKKQDDCA